MKWIGISGSWRKTNKQIEHDVISVVRKAVSEGSGIVTGGALGVDYMATDEVMRIDPTLNKFKVLLPSSLTTYTTHYRKRAQEGVITTDQAERLISQLESVIGINPKALIEGWYDVLTKETYYERNSWVVDSSDELYVFHVNQSKGVQDTIIKAKQKDIPIHIRTYTI